MATTITVADYVSKQIEISGKPQRDIAAEVGWPKPNIISMIKQGQTKVPIDRAPALAKALRVDPAHFTKMVMREYMPDAWKAIEGTFGESLTGQERELVSLYRETFGGEDVPIDVAAVREALKSASR